ncbi:MAG: hypothetical protein JOY58_07445 [Solirubrobacterales bacterium]|nr:hypothetical protein [Solirubrobacterales bacterium]
MTMIVLDQQRADAVRSLCELLVPGSARVGPEVYIDALLARMPEPERAAVLAAVDTLAPCVDGGAEALGEHQLTPDFALVRALACEAFYSDFVAPGAAGPGAWDEIDFKPPLAARLDKDWSYLGVSR